MSLRLGNLALDGKCHVMGILNVTPDSFYDGGLHFDLADTQKEKFNKLAEEVDYSTEADYRQKITTIKESYFKSKDVSGDGIDEVATGEGTQPEDLSNAMAAYSAAISQTKNIKLSNK